MRILLLALFLASCGRVDDFIDVGVELNRKKSDPTFNEFVVTFQNYYNRTVTVPIVFNTLADRIAGVCYVYSTGYREIQIDPSRWASYSHEQREQLIFHELGHCVFNRDHDDTMLNNYCPNSIMRSFLFNQWEINNCYTPEYNHYIEELGK